jgi:type IV pilus assembly protein PilB
MTGDTGESQEVSEQLGFCYVDLSRTGFAAGAAALLPEEVARREKAVPIERRGTVTVVAVSTPADRFTLDALRTATRGEVVAVVAPAAQVAAALVQLYGENVLRHERRRVLHQGHLGRASRRPAAPPGEWQTENPPPSDPAPPRWEPIVEDVAPVTTPSPIAPVPPQPVAPRMEAPPSTLAEAPPSTLAEAPPSAPPEAPAAAPATSRAAPAAAAEAPIRVPSPDAPLFEAPPPPPPASGDLEVTFSVAAPAAEPDLAAVLPTEGAPSSPPGDLEVTFSVPAPAAEPDLAAVLPTEAAPSSPPGDLEVTFSVAAPSAEPDLAAVLPTEALSSPPPPPPGSGSPGGGAAVDAAGLAGDAVTGVASGSVGDSAWPPFARALVSKGKVSPPDMALAVRDHAALGESLTRYLLRERLVVEEDLVEVMANEVGLPFVDLGITVPDPVAATLVPAAVARRHMVLPIGFDGDVPVIAMADPADVFALDDLRSILGRNFRQVVATRAQIDVHLRRFHESDSDVQAAAQHAAGTTAPSDGGFQIESLQSVVEDAPIIRYVNLLILQALNERASDIHIEPTPKRLRIRFRIDGVMHDASSASPAIHSAVISRLKVLGEMDITEHRVPQEGRVSVSVGERQIDLRLAVIPSLYGESCVMRLLDKSASIRRLSELGFFQDTLDNYAQAYHQPYGVILVTGPTGAGKTTTLYATLQEVMSPEKSVVTVEDPVEYQIAGITQVQINSKVGMRFSTALRSILRADPDIILVGEIRDIETATIAMEAALSGHLVLSTLHTNTAASTPLRLTEMGIEPFLVTSAVSGVLTQRLARVLCDRCKVPFDASLADFHAAGYKDDDLEGLDMSRLFRANGCHTCANTGYYGRMILSEVMPMSEEIQRMIIEQRSILAMEREAVNQGMRTLRQDGLRKAIAGFTTLEEVLRVVA